jgi:putative peptidoglycan lipid II flippase
MSRTLLKSTSVVGATTLLSRITGLMRDVALAQAFGASALQDAFLVAYKIPNFLRRLFAEGAFSQSFVPVISGYRHQRSQADVKELVGGVTGTLGAVLLAVTALGVLGAPLIILVYATGFTRDAGKFELTVHMLRWTFPYLFFISLTALYSGVLNSYRQFALPAFTQVAMNVVLIVTALFIAVHSANPGIALAMGVFVAGAVQLAMQLPAVARLGLLAWPRWRPAAEGVRRIGRLMVPGIIGSSMAQVSLVLDTTIASWLVTGSVSWLYFADRLMEFPLGVFSVALGTVILPNLSVHHAERSGVAFSDTLDWALRLTLLLVMPAAVGLLAFSGPITAAIFGYRNFTPHSVQMASWALMAYSWGLVMFSLVKVLAPGYFARQDTRTPVRAGLIALAVNMAMNVGIALPAAHYGFPVPHVLLATATCTGSAVNVFLLWRGLVRQGVHRPSAAWRRLLPRIGIACVVMAVLLVWWSGSLDAWMAYGPAVRLLRCGLGITAAAATYFAVLYALGLRPDDLRTKAA